jgi:hypothetical protein
MPSIVALKAWYASLTVVFLALLVGLLLGTIQGRLAPLLLAGLATGTGVAGTGLAALAWTVGQRLGLSRGGAAGLAMAALVGWTSPLALAWVLMQRAPPQPPGVAR